MILFVNRNKGLLFITADFFKGVSSITTRVVSQVLITTKVVAQSVVDTIGSFISTITSIKSGNSEITTKYE